MKKILLILLTIVFLTANIHAEDANPENVTKLYVATFDRAPDKAGLDYWVNDSNLSLEAIATSFFDQDETKTLYPDGYDDYDFILAIYKNLFARDPDSEGGEYWQGELSKGAVSKSVFILAVVNGAKDDDAKILANKTEVGLALAESDLNDTTIGKMVMSNITADHNSVDDTFEGLFANNLTPMNVIDNSVINGDSVTSTDSESTALATDIINTLDNINESLKLTNGIYISDYKLASKIMGHTAKASSMLDELSKIVEEKNSLKTIARLGKILLNYSSYSFANFISIELDGTIMLVDAIEDLDLTLDEAYSYYVPGMVKPYFSNHTQIDNIVLHLSADRYPDMKQDGRKILYDKWDFDLDDEGMGGIPYKGYYNIELTNGKHVYVPYGRSYYKFGYYNKDRLCGFSSWSWCW